MIVDLPSPLVCTIQESVQCQRHDPKWSNFVSETSILVPVRLDGAVSITVKSPSTGISYKVGQPSGEGHSRSATIRRASVQDASPGAKGGGFTFACHVVKLHDADGPIHCANGEKIRVAGVNAREVDGTCRSNAPCPVMRHEQAKPIAERLVLRKTLTCQPVGTSYKRVVARCQLPDGRSLSCALIAAGAATRWDSYWRRYGMGVCR